MQDTRGALEMYTKLQIGKLKGNLKYVGVISKTLVKLSLHSQFMNCSYQYVEENSVTVE
jgi:hypothetical protein